LLRITVDVHNVFSDTESIVQRYKLSTNSLFGCYDIWAQDCRLSQPQPQKHSGYHGVRYEGYSPYFICTQLYIYITVVALIGIYRS